MYRRRERHLQPLSIIVVASKGRVFCWRPSQRPAAAAYAVQPANRFPTSATAAPAAIAAATFTIPAAGAAIGLPDVVASTTNASADEAAAAYSVAVTASAAHGWKRD